LTDPFRFEAKYYDKIWGLADRYKAEAKFLNQMLKEHGAHGILDLGCGTGGHCIELAKLGYDVVGLDVSELMIEKASEKSSKEGLQAIFILGDVTQTSTILKNATLPSAWVIRLLTFWMTNHLEKHWTKQERS